MMMQQLALVPADDEVDPAELARVGAALQKQVLRDVAPIWGVSACVAAFPRLEELPLGYWPILLSARDASTDAGVHLDDNGQPYARVQLSPHWSHEASRACLELLLNPMGERCVSGGSPREDQGLVAYLVEVCAASALLSDGYSIDGVLVSDFCTPAYFVPESRLGPHAYSFHGSLAAPLALREGGRLTWFDLDSNSWWLRTRSGERSDDRRLGALDRPFLSVRELVGPQPCLPSPHGWHERMRFARGEAQRASYARARRLRTLLGLSNQVQPVLLLERPSAPPPLPSPSSEALVGPSDLAPAAATMTVVPEGAAPSPPQPAEASYEPVNDAELERLIVEVAPVAVPDSAPKTDPEASTPAPALGPAPAPPAPVAAPPTPPAQPKRPVPRTAARGAMPRRAPVSGPSSRSSLAPSLALEREPTPSGLRDTKLLAIAAAVGIGFFALVARERSSTHAAPRVPAASPRVEARGPTREQNVEARGSAREPNQVIAASALPLPGPVASPTGQGTLSDAGLGATADSVASGAAAPSLPDAKGAAAKSAPIAAAAPRPAKRKTSQAPRSAGRVAGPAPAPAPHAIEDLLDTRR